MSWWKWEPKIERAITSTKLSPILRKLAPTAAIFYMDRTYFIPADPDEVMYYSPSKRFKYIKQSRDCDDFSRILRGWLSEKGFGNLLAMDCVIDYFSLRKLKTVRHAVIAFLHEGEIIFGDPGSGKIAAFNQIKIIRLIV